MAGDSTLPLDLWTEILSRLPPKTLVRFRCVSKSFFSLIHNPNLINVHKNRFNNNNNNGFLLWEELQSFRVRTLDDDFRIREEIMNISYSEISRFYYHYIACTDGLVLFGSVSPVNLYLFNPSIRKFLRLPKLPPHCSKSFVSSTHLGFDPVTSDYKVLVVKKSMDGMNNNDYSNPGYTAIYALSTRCWKVISRVEDPNPNQLRRSVFVKGVKHWMSSSSLYSSDCTHIVSFDFATEVFSHTKLPPGLDTFGGGGILIPFVLRDSLALFCVSGLSICISVLGEQGDNGLELWNKWYYHGHLDVDTFQFFEKPFMLLCIDKSEKLLLLVDGAGRVKSYDLKNHRIEDLHKSVGNHCVKCPYVETLVLLNHPFSTSTLPGKIS